MASSPVAGTARGARAPATVSLPVLLCGVAIGGLSAWLILEGHLVGAGAAAAGSGLLLLIGSRLGGWEPSPVVRFVDPIADRAFDGMVLTALAWRLHGSDPTSAALAVVALSAGFFGAYARARGQALGYPVEESRVNRAARYTLLATGLLLGWVEGALWFLAALTVLTTLVRVSQVAKKERE
jgi:hypothetical protein